MKIKYTTRVLIFMTEGKKGFMLNYYHILVLDVTPDPHEILLSSTENTNLYLLILKKNLCQIKTLNWLVGIYQF